MSLDLSQALVAAESAVARDQLTSSALENLRAWLTQPRYSEYVPAIIEQIEASKWRELDDAFWTVIPFGTGGRRGRMYPFGSNTINDRTIGESAQGLADYVKSVLGSTKRLSCAIAYDTRHRSRHFAELCASIMVANGFHVYFLDEFRATPQLSLAVRHFQCDCGIMVTASHNPPSDNAVKVYWSTGGQVLPPHDKAIIDRVMNTETIQRVDFSQAFAAGQVEIVTDIIDRAYVLEASRFAYPGSRDVRIVFSPLHGVGSKIVLPLLRAANFENVFEYPGHAEPNGDFPNVPGHVSNPENPKVFDAILPYAKECQAHLILATDPDADRMGCLAPLTFEPNAEWRALNGNQLGALLADFVLSKLKATGTLSSEHYVIITLVTTNLTRKIAHAYGARCEGNIHVGFKWIADLIDRCGPARFAFGTEESHGYLVGEYVRDKDGGVACLLMSLLAAELKEKGKTLHQRMDELLIQHGYHEEDVLNVFMEGSQGMAKMNQLMTALRVTPPSEIGGIAVTKVRDYDSLTTKHIGGESVPLEAPKGNMVILDLVSEGNYVAVRPSGTEPKVKFYFFTYLPPSAFHSVPEARGHSSERISAFRKDLQAYVDRVTN